jgi:hypothetical protein
MLQSCSTLAGFSTFKHFFAGVVVILAKVLTFLPQMLNIFCLKVAIFFLPEFQRF